MEKCSIGASLSNMIKMKDNDVQKPFLIKMNATILPQIKKVDYSKPFQFAVPRQHRNEYRFY